MNYVLTCLLHFELHKGLQCLKRSVNKRIFAKKYLGITYIIIISWFFMLKISSMQDLKLGGQAYLRISFIRQFNRLCLVKKNKMKWWEKIKYVIYVN